MASEGSQRSDQLEIEKLKRDPRVVVTGLIWAMTIPALAISTTLCELSPFGILFPFFAIGAAGFGTAAIWRGGTKSVSSDRKENQRLQDRIKELEERLANVETISRFEMQLAAREKAALEDGLRQSVSESFEAPSGQKESA